jgi:protocatechuate 3,4-dioxygenase beta subunit
VKFTVATGHGLLSVDSTATDTLGVATVLWTLGDTAAKVNTLAIVSGDGVDSLHVVTVAGPPSYLVPVSATSTDAAVGTPVSVQVRATDRPGNPAVGATVFWVATGGTLSSASSVADASGVARVTFTSNQAGSFTISAVIPETASRDFQITVD